MGSVVAVCRVHQLLPDSDVVGVTAIDKRPVTGAVKVNLLGVYGDVQADRQYHGGIDQAVYAYSEESARWWSAELGADVTPGMFGENLRTAGLDVDGAVIGERWQVGASVLLEVTGPRIPCATFGRFLGQRSWVKRFYAAGLPGAYLRVVQRGLLAAGDEVTVVSRPDHGVTVARWLTEASADDARALAAAAAGAGTGSVQLAATVREQVDLVLARA